MTAILRGMTWDHPRGIDPLIATTSAFREKRPDIDIKWDARPLSAYEDRPIEQIVDDYDIILVNHPFMGDCAQSRLLVPVEEWLPGDVLTAQAEASLGPSHESYFYEGVQYALAIDAASIVSAYRPEALAARGLTPPQTLDDVWALLIEFGEQSVGLPLAAQHAFSAFVSLAAHLGGQTFWGPDGMVVEVAGEALDTLGRLAARMSGECLQLNPIDVLERLSRRELAYVPFTYGYVSYVRPRSGATRVAFADIPTLSGEPSGGVLGGVGIGVSTQCHSPEAAFAFLDYVTTREVQSGMYADGGGQPAHRGAWEAPEVAEAWPGFYPETIKSLDNSYLRPRPPGFPDFQKNARELILRFLREGGSTATVAKDINRAYMETCMPTAE